MFENTADVEQCGFTEAGVFIAREKRFSTFPKR